MTITETADRNIVTVSMLNTDGLAEFLSANVDCPEVWEAVRAVLAGESDSVMIGGGAAPVCEIRRA